jgi:bifunctional ADP-heptose synthase (sugar kinase/adenylyltransferase)
VCLDRWCSYDPAAAEPSRETGIARIGVVGTTVTPGAAGTVANNLAALGVGRVEVLGLIGEDGFGYELSRALRERNIGSDFCVRAQGMQTFTYTKLLNSTNGVEDQPRIDFINTVPVPPEVERELLDKIQLAIDQFDVILISDQAETSQGGAITEAVRELFRELAPVYGDKIFFADSRARIHLFRKVIVKPNRQEADAACRKLFGRIDYQRLLEHVRARLMLVTHGADGVLVVEPGGETWVKTHPVEHPVDICGAGDSFSAGAAMALAVTGSPLQAARIGNLVAAVTIMKKGTGTASPGEVVAADARACD